MSRYQLRIEETSEVLEDESLRRLYEIGRFIVRDAARDRVERTVCFYSYNDVNKHLGINDGWEYIGLMMAFECGKATMGGLWTRKYTVNYADTVLFLRG